VHPCGQIAVVSNFLKTLTLIWTLPWNPRSACVFLTQGCNDCLESMRSGSEGSRLSNSKEVARAVESDYSWILPGISSIEMAAKLQ